MKRNAFVTQGPWRDDKIIDIDRVDQGASAAQANDVAGAKGDQLVKAACGIRAFCGRAQDNWPTLMLKNRKRMVGLGKVVGLGTITTDDQIHVFANHTVYRKRRQ